MITENVTVLCTNMLETNTAFGFRADTGEQVFIPANVAERACIKIGDTLNVTVIPNFKQPEKTPWFAIFVSPAGEPSGDVPKAASVDDRISAAISTHEGAYHTTAEIAELVFVDTTTASNALNRLFKQGRVARADVYGKPDQQRPSFCLWAENTDRFIDGE